LYLVGLVTIPREGERDSMFVRALHGPDRRLAANDVVLLGLLAAAVALLFRDGRAVVGALVFLGLALLVLSRRASRPVPTAGGESDAGTAAPPQEGPKRR